MGRFTKIWVYFAYYLADNRSYQGFKGFFKKILNGEKSIPKTIFDFFMIFLILSSVGILIYDVKNDIPQILYDFEDFVLYIFLVEYLLRFWAYNDSHQIVIEHYERATLLNDKVSLWKITKAIISKKIDYVSSPMAIIDLLALLPSFRGFRVLRIFLLFRLIKLFRYTRSINEFIKVLADKKFELVTLNIIVFFMIFASSTAIYVFEGNLENSGIGNFFDAVYWAFVTISTVGYGDISPSTHEGKIVAIILIMSGIALISFSTSIVATAFGEKLSELKSNRVKNEIEKLNDFIVVCGYGEIGAVVAEKLALVQDKFVVVEKNPERIEMAKRNNHLIIEGDAKHSDTLRLAGVGSGAKKILCLTNSEVVNIYITLSAKDIDPSIEVISRINNKSSEKKFLLSGANRVIYPFEISALVASEYTGQAVAFEAIYGIVNNEKYGISIDDVEVKSHSFLINKSLKELNLSQYKITLFGVIREQEQNEKIFLFNPQDDFILQNGDFIVIIGNDINIVHVKQKLERSILNA